MSFLIVKFLFPVRADHLIQQSARLIKRIAMPVWGHLISWYSASDGNQFINRATTGSYLILISHLWDEYTGHQCLKRRFCMEYKWILQSNLLRLSWTACGCKACTALHGTLSVSLFCWALSDVTTVEPKVHLAPGGRKTVCLWDMAWGHLLVLPVSSGHIRDLQMQYRDSRSEPLLCHCNAVAP